MARRSKKSSSSAGPVIAVLLLLTLALLVVAIVMSNGGGGGGGTVASVGPPTSSSAPEAPPSSTDLTVLPTSEASPLPARPVPTPPPQPVPADACHQGGVTYCVLNPDVTQATSGQTICVSGWTSTVRPPESYTEPLKIQQIRNEGLPGSVSQYEEDHRMPLELGGAPRDIDNLSPESPRAPNPKDSDETRLKDAVCGGQLTLAQARDQMVQTWLAAYPGYRQ